MELNILKPRKALNKAFLKVKANRPEIETFKKNLIGIIDTIDEFESEEFHKNLVSDFLKNTYYGGNHFINTKDRKDLVIHNGATASSTVGVIIEAKSPTNKAEMLRPDNINCKAFQELVLYYLRERIINKNTEIKHLIATNIYEWYIFDGHLFEKLFAQNKPLIKKFIDFQEKRSGGYNTDFFYSEIAAPAIAALPHEIAFTYFDIRDYDKPLRNNDQKDDNVLIALYKLLSPEHLLKLPFANDSNSLDKAFYTELLHIIGLTETKEGGKKLIQRKEKGQRNAASLMESAIIQLDNLDKLSRMDKPSQYGDTTEERLFNVALELSITWINRILFLKLLEAQLIKYHKGDKTYAFLNTDKVKGFDDLNTLFFQVLAKVPAERSEEVRHLFEHVPYPNSSLFEPTDIEHAGVFISQLNDAKLPLLSNSVIKDNTGKKRTGELTAVEYLFEFLNAYDFSSEGSEEIQEDNKRLINASVLGLIFEKINGYKDGSFFTPGFITMYMCRETIRRAVIQKFNDVKGWNCKAIHDLYDKIEDRREANAIINSLKLCDPAVGSGHFLVSALNEIIAIKSELRILSDREGKRLKEYIVEVENDELIVTDEDGKLFEYNPTSRESQRVQETLFHEKQTIIENCLFGVDLNPNSVKICRLRLWIELLKNAYYRTPSNSPEGGELETLPNIDINIKCGNSLISRYALDTDIHKALKGSKWTIDSYRMAVMTYRNAQSKDEKRSMEKLITEIKNDFVSEIASNDKRLTGLNTLRGELYKISNQTQLFELSKTEKAKFNKEVEEKTTKIAKLEAELEEIRNNKIYENAFEWRFEFPEVLNDEGDFMGFDVVIGNPPYIFSRELIGEEDKRYFYQNYFLTQFKLNTYILFCEKGFSLLNNKGTFSFIIPNNWLTLQNNSDFREFVLNNGKYIIVVNDKNKTFEDASVDTSILIFSKTGEPELEAFELNNQQFRKISKSLNSKYINSKNSIINYDFYTNSYTDIIIKKIECNTIPLEKLFDVKNGIQAYTVGEGEPIQTKEMKDSRVYHSDVKYNDDWIKYLDGIDVKRYALGWSNQFVKYGKNLSRRRTPDLFTGKRILVRQIPSKLPYAIISTFIDEHAICDNNSMIIKEINDSNYSLLKLLGILNSKLISYWFETIFAKNQRKLFPQFKINELKSFPIPKEDSNLMFQIETIVNQVIVLKNNDINSDTTSLESEIDRLVYQLYGLTEEEVKIVEGKG